MTFKDAAHKWDARYHQAPGLLFGEQPNAWLARHAELLKPSSQICCLADGEGRNSTWLASQEHVVNAFDVSPVAVKKLRKLAAQRKVAVTAEVLSAEDWLDRPVPAETSVLPDAFAAIFIQFADPDLRQRLFAAMARGLRPGGLLILEGYGPQQIHYRTGGPGIASHLYNLAMIHAAFPGWQTLASRDVHTDLSEGSAHAGRSHLVSVVLRKPVG